MKIARLSYNNNETYGIVNGDNVSTRDEMIRETGIDMPQNIKDFLFEGGYDKISDKAQGLPYGDKISRYKILSPIPDPGKIICLAFNYTDHAREQGLQAPKAPVIIIKPRTALNSTKSDIMCPDFVTQLDYEIELALVIKRDCKNVTIEDADDAIFGYMILNDVSARDIQLRDKQFTRAKGFDSFAPCGPWITTRDEIIDPHNLKMTTRINGSLRQDSTSSNMAIKIPEIVSEISKVMTLEKGDIISTGTPAGVMLNSSDAVFLKDGDEIEMEIEGLGRLENTVRIIQSSQT